MNIAILAFLAANAMRPGGDMRDGAMGPPPGGASAPSASVTIAAMPYARTVTCSTYTLTGTATGGAAVTWAASPSGASGACTGTDSWSCVVDVDPDAVGEGVEVITVTSGTATDTETIGFYVDGEHSCFLAQSVNGAYNVGLSNLDAVATWENLGSSALDVTQGTGAAQPTFRTSIVGGQPVVRCDGGDRVAAATASDWTFLYQGADFTVEHVHKWTSGTQTYVTTQQSASVHGMTTSGDITGKTYFYIYNATPTINFSVVSGSVNTVAKFNLLQSVLDDDGGAGADAFTYNNGGAATTATRASTYSVTTAQPLNLCAFNGGTSPLNGDFFRVHIYQSALSSTQRGINKAVDEWALGGTLPVTP